MPMKCSRCDVEMTILAANDATCSHCPKCGGMWFEVNALDRVVDHGLHSLPLLADLPETAPPAPPCPACANPLHALTTIGPVRLRVGACKVCHGRWLDGQELRAVRGSGVLGTLRRVFGGA
ncbi:MAG: zf-TFIIB domain-containing protein [Planctomycetota bacterium]